MSKSKKFRTARLQPTDKSLVFAVLRGHRAQWGMLCISTPIQSTCLVLEWSIVSEDAPAFAFGGAEVQANLLRADGIEVDEDGYVDLAKYQWNPDRD